MRRLTLILSDLYFPEDAGRGTSFPAVLDLPNLDGLLRFAQRVGHIADWRTWLDAQIGTFNLAHMSVAQCCAIRAMTTSAASTAWLATPVHLEARIDHVRLSDRGLLRMGAPEREAWTREFALAFGPEYTLHDAGERGFLLSGAAAARVASVDPARLLDADIGQALPTGPSAGELRRLGTEIEMWLHGAPANLARERRRERRVSALWFWGGGVGDAAAHVETTRTPRDGTVLYGGDPFVAALADGRCEPAPETFAGIQIDERHCVVEFAPMSGPAAESLAALDAHWFAPALHALRRGGIDSVEIIANDRCFRITPRARLRFWRRRNAWLAHFARVADAKP